MQLELDDLTYLSQKAMQAAKKAGQLIERYASGKVKDIKVHHKTSGSTLASQVVTEVDLLSEAIILEILNPTCESFDLALLTEEAEDDKERLLKDYFWCIDPLDGTLAFIESTPGYAVSIGLVSKTGIPVIGVTYNPVTNTLCSCVKGQGLYRNGKLWNSHFSSKGSHVLTVAYDRSLLKFRELGELKHSLQIVADAVGLSDVKMVAAGGAVINAYTVLQNSPACYFKFPIKVDGGGSLWDFAASAAIFNETGAVATDFYGNALDLNRADSTFMNHRGVIFATDQAIADELKKIL